MNPEIIRDILMIIAAQLITYFVVWSETRRYYVKLFRELMNQTEDEIFATVTREHPSFYTGAMIYTDKLNANIDHALRIRKDKKK